MIIVLCGVGVFMIIFGNWLKNNDAVAEFGYDMDAWYCALIFGALMLIISGIAVLTMVYKNRCLAFTLATISIVACVLFAGGAAGSFYSQSYVKEYVYDECS